jgi:hypothetical protein
MMQAENTREDPIEYSPSPPEPGPSCLRIVHSAPASKTPERCATHNPPLPEADWHLLFNAVKFRLKTAASRPDTVAVVVPECIEALEWLQDRLDPLRHHGR